MDIHMASKKELRNRFIARTKNPTGRAFFVQAPPVLMGYHDTPDYYDREIKSTERQKSAAVSKKMPNTVARHTRNLDMLRKERERAIQAHEKRVAFDATPQGRSWAAFIRNLKKEQTDKKLQLLKASVFRL